MRRTTSRRCLAPLESWAAEYLERIGAGPATECSSHDAAAPSPRQSACCSESAITLSQDEAAHLRAKYEAERRAFVKGLRLRPFSYARVTGRPTCDEAAGKLRGLSYGDYTPLNNTPTTTEGAKGRADRYAEKTPEEISSAALAAGRRFPASSSSSLQMHSTPLHWPSFTQLTQELEHHTMTRTYLWESYDSHKGRTAALPKSASPITTSSVYASTPSLLALYPYSVLLGVVEHAVRHAWRGSPRVYPANRLPTPDDRFRFTGCPRLTPQDVAGQDWDRGEAAHFLLSVLQQRCVQQDLRRRLWAAAQRYHRTLLTDLELLSTPANDNDRDSNSVPFIELDSGQGSQHTVKVPLEKVRRELFSFPADVHFTLAPRSEISVVHDSKRGRVILRPLRSSHWFHFVSQDRDVVRVLSERPHTQLFVPASAFAKVTDDAEKLGGHQRTWTTQEQLWLLLSEMVRLRILVAYLLHLETFLFQMRNAAPSSSARVRKGGAGERVLEGGAAAQYAQEAHDALYVGEVFDFLDIQPHHQLQRRSHNLRFLSKFQISCDTPGELSGDDGQGGSQRGGDAADPSSGVPSPEGKPTHSCCFSTVQELFSAFSKAMGVGVVVPGDAKVVSSPPSAKSGAAGSVKRRSEAEGYPRVQEELHGAHVPGNVDGVAGDAPLSATDESFLAAIMAQRHAGTRDHRGKRRKAG